MISAKSLRDKNNLKLVPNDKPGYYKWWAKIEDLQLLLNSLNVNFEDIKNDLEVKDNYYCIYVGIAVNESIRNRLNWHINDSHTEKQVQTGYLSTMRQSIASLIVHNQYDKQATNDFIDRLKLEYFVSNNDIHSNEAEQEIHQIERELMAEHLCILNNKENHYKSTSVNGKTVDNPLVKNIKDTLSSLRKNSKSLLDKSTFL